MSTGNTILFGGSGLLGSIFLKKYPHIISVGRTKPSEGINNTHIHLPHIDALHVLDDIEFDKVIFLIGNSNHHMLNKGCMEGINYNVIPLKKTLHYLKQRNLNRFVCLTSILLYGNEPKDRAVHEKDEVFPYQNEYIFSKFLAEQVVEFYKEIIPIINVRISNIYGNTTLDRPDLIPTLIKDCILKEDPSVWSDKPVRDFIFAEDCAEAIMKLILETNFKGTINIGTGKSYSVREVCDILEELSGKKITSENKEVTGVMRFKTDISLLKTLTDWEPQHTLKQGLTKAYEIMKNNYTIDE